MDASYNRVHIAALANSQVLIVRASANDSADLRCQISTLDGWSLTSTRSNVRLRSSYLTGIDALSVDGETNVGMIVNAHRNFALFQFASSAGAQQLLIDGQFDHIAPPALSNATSIAVFQLNAAFGPMTGQV